MHLVSDAVSSASTPAACRLLFSENSASTRIACNLSQRSVHGTHCFKHFGGCCVLPFLCPAAVLRLQPAETSSLALPLLHQHSFIIHKHERLGTPTSAGDAPLNSSRGTRSFTLRLLRQESFIIKKRERMGPLHDTATPRGVGGTNAFVGLGKHSTRFSA